jgi:signal transduction histidine kinase
VSAPIRVPAFLAEMMAPANRARLWFGIWTGYAIAIGFGALAVAASALHLIAWQWAFAVLVGGKLVTNTLALAGLAADRGVLATQALNTTADIVMLTGAIYVTGGAYSPLLATYVIVITVLSLLANRTITLVMAGGIVVLFAAMMIAMAAGVLPPTPVPGAPGAPPSAAYTVVAIIYLIVVVGVPAWFSSATLQKLQLKERTLEQRTAQLIGANTQRSQFVASMTHELRTPIHGVQGLADVIAAGVYGPVTDKQREACASIKRSAQSLLALVDDVLNLTRAEAGRVDARPSAIDVAALIEQVTASVSWMIGTKPITLETAIEPELPVVASDGRWLAHVMVNLVANAVKFTPDGGTITVSAHQRGDTVVLAVADTGIGIKPEDRAAIFEPFRQGDSSDEKRYGGVGLGLALVARLTELLAAEVELDSEVGKGSTFRVIVPIAWRGRATTQLLRPPRAPTFEPVNETATRREPGDRAR